MTGCTVGTVQSHVVRIIRYTASLSDQQENGCIRAKQKTEAKLKLRWETMCPPLHYIFHLLTCFFQMSQRCHISYVQYLHIISSHHIFGCMLWGCALGEKRNKLLSRK